MPSSAPQAVVATGELPLAAHTGDGRPLSPSRVQDVRDGPARLVGIPGFGLTIPHLTGLFGPLTPQSGWFWFGTLWFVLLAAAIWEGNRALLFFQRRHLDWFDRPGMKVVALVAACVLYTAPLTAFFLYAWFSLSGLPLDAEALIIVSLTNVICVLFVTHAYETAFLIKGRHVDTAHLADLERAATQAQLEALRQQVDPHFLFNSLNTLGALIEMDPERASAFNAALADVYRYLLDNRPLVPLEEERAFTSSYALLLQTRFKGSVVIREVMRNDAATDNARALVPPTAIQTLVENAVKHTRFSDKQPLSITVEFDRQTVRVRNPRRPKSDGVASAKVGLKNLDERCRLLVGRGIDVQMGDDEVTVVVPLLLSSPHSASAADRAAVGETP